MSDSTEFESRLAASLQPVREQIQADQDAAKLQAKEARRKKVEEDERRAKAHGVQIRFRDNFIKPCYKAIQKQISGGSGIEHGDPSPGWTFRLDYDKARIEMMIEHSNTGFRVVARTYANDSLAYNESILFSDDEFSPEEGGEWLEQHAIECTKIALAAAGPSTSTIEYDRGRP